MPAPEENHARVLRAPAAPQPASSTAPPSPSATRTRCSSSASSPIDAVDRGRARPHPRLALRLGRAVLPARPAHRLRQSLQSDLIAFRCSPHARVRSGLGGRHRSGKCGSSRPPGAFARRARGSWHAGSPLAASTKELTVTSPVRALRDRPHPRARACGHDRRRRGRLHRPPPRRRRSPRPRRRRRRPPPPSPRWTRTRRPGPRRWTSPSTTSRRTGRPRRTQVDEDEDLITKCSEFDLEELSLAVYNTDDFSHR